MLLKIANYFLQFHSYCPPQKKKILLKNRQKINPNFHLFINISPYLPSPQTLFYWKLCSLCKSFGFRHKLRVAMLLKANTMLNGFLFKGLNIFVIIIIIFNISNYYFILAKVNQNICIYLCLFLRLIINYYLRVKKKSNLHL